MWMNQGRIILCIESWKTRDDWLIDRFTYFYLYLHTFIRILLVLFCNLHNRQINTKVCLMNKLYVIKKNNMICFATQKIFPIQNFHTFLQITHKKEPSSFIQWLYIIKTLLSAVHQPFRLLPWHNKLKWSQKKKI